MDRKSILVLSVSVLVLISWNVLVTKIYPPKPAPARPTNLVSAASKPATPAANQPGDKKGAAAVETVIAATTSQTPVPPVSGEETTLALENKDVRYLFTSRGGGLRLVELKKYPESVGCQDKSRSGTNKSPGAIATLNTRAPVPAMVVQAGDPAFQDLNANFSLTKTENGVRAERMLTNGLRLIKTFDLSTNYLLQVSVRYENPTDNPVKIPGREWVVGTATPMGTHDESLQLGFEWYNGAKSEKITSAWFANAGFACMAGNPRTVYEAGASNVVWAGVHNQFFTMVAVPQFPAFQVVARPVSLPPPSASQLTADPAAFTKPTGYQTALAHAEVTLGAKQALDQKYEVFTGPKEYATLARLSHNLDLVMGFDGFFGFFAKALLLSMNALHKAIPSYGVAIILITIIIKAIFWPLTTASTRSMKRMQALQPQMKALQEKYKDDPKKMNTKLMEFMKENKVSPLGGCLPMLFQIPVFFGFYRMLQSAIELRGESFLWACDLSQPDTLFMIPGINFPFNLMPLLMGATMLWQASMTPPAPGMDPAQQKIMKYMPLMMMFFLYKFSAGLTLYWTCQNLLSIAQMKLTREKPAQPPTGPTPPARGPGLAPKRKLA